MTYIGRASEGVWVWAEHLKENTPLLVHLITTESGQSCSYYIGFVEGLNTSYQAGEKLEFSLTLWQSVLQTHPKDEPIWHSQTKASPGAQLEQRGPPRNILKDKCPARYTAGDRGTPKITGGVQRQKYPDTLKSTVSSGNISNGKDSTCWDCSIAG